MAEVIKLLSKREINWCEGGQGFGAFCPGPSDPESFKYCCTSLFFGTTKPSCCQFPINTGVLIASSIACIILFLLFLWLYCWCWPSSYLNKRRLRNLTLNSPMNVARDEIFIRRNSYECSIPFK